MSGETHYAKSGNVHIAYQVLGDGPRDLILVPGWISHVELGWGFPAFAHFLNRLASFSRLIIFDKRGTGLSDPVMNTPTLEERMDDLTALMDAVGSKRATLFGECEGAPACVLYAATHPERVEALALYGSMPCIGADTPDPRWSGRRQDQLEELVAHWGEGRMLDLFAPTVARSDRVRRSMGQFERASASPAMACALLESLREIDVTSAARSIHVPTVVMHRRDEFVPIEPARRLAELIPGARFIELEGRDHALIGDTDRVVDEIEEFVTGARPRPRPTRALMTMLFTDIVGSTRLAAELGDARWRGLLTEHHRIIRELLDEYHGREIGTAGDGFFATFDGPARAIWCVQAITEAVRQLDIEIRAGVHTGEVELLADGVGGLAVHIAARVQALAGPGEILVTRTVRDLVAGSGIEFTERGAHTLKGVPGEWEVLAVAADSGRPRLESVAV